MSLAKITLIGNLGRDPELRYTPDGTAVCQFPLATTVRRKDKDDVTAWFDVTTWFDVHTWRAQAELASKYLTKGSQVYVEGRFTLEEYQDRDGNKRTKARVDVTEIQLIGSKQESER